MTDDDKAQLIAAIMTWRHAYPEVAGAIQGMLLRCNARLMAELPDDDLQTLYDACESIAEVSDGGFF